MKAAIFLLVAILVSGCASDPAPLITVADARVTALPRSAAIYFTLTNSGGRDRLLGVDAGSVGKATLHETRMDGDMMHMRGLDRGIEVPERGQVRLAASGKHVMVQQLARPLVPGSTLALTLRFERQGSVRIAPTIAGPR